MDDDTYVNVPALVELLQVYNHTHDWYLGKPSLNHPLEKQDIVNRNVSYIVQSFVFYSPY